MKKKIKWSSLVGHENTPSSDVWAINEMKYKVMLFSSLFSVLAASEVAEIMT